MCQMVMKEWKHFKGREATVHISFSVLSNQELIPQIYSQVSTSAEDQFTEPEEEYEEEGWQLQQHFTMKQVHISQSKASVPST